MSQDALRVKSEDALKSLSRWQEIPFFFIAPGQDHIGAGVGHMVSESLLADLYCLLEPSLPSVGIRQLGKDSL